MLQILIHVKLKSELRAMDLGKDRILDQLLVTPGWKRDQVVAADSRECHIPGHFCAQVQGCGRGTSSRTNLVGRDSWCCGMIL